MTTTTQPGITITSNVAAPPPVTYSIAGGMWLAMAAFYAQIQAVQSYDSNGLIPLSAAIQQAAEKNANWWIMIMSTGNTPINPATGKPWTIPEKFPNGSSPAHADMVNFLLANPGFFSDQEVLQWDALQGGNASIFIQEDAATLNIHNTLYNQASSFYSGLNNATNQNSSSVLQTVQIALQLYQQGPQSELQTIASII